MSSTINRPFFEWLRGNATDNASIAAALAAMSASPTLTGNVAMAGATSVTVPNVAANDNSNNAANTKFVKDAVANLVGAAPAQLDTLNEFAAALGNDANFAATVATSLGQKAPIASPNFSGIPLVDTAGPGTTTRQVASTAFVVNEVAAQVVNAPAMVAKLKSTEGGFARRVLSQAKSQPVRILMIGTSISENQGAPNQVIAEQLKATYGDAKLYQERLGLLGGSWTAAFSGWEKQPFGGISYTRLRGKSTSTAFSRVVYGSKIEIWYSKETTANGAGSFVLNVDGTDYTIDCTGASQSYGNVFTVPGLSLGTHTVTFNPPATGNVYLEHMVVSQGLPGIEIIRGNLGGSALQDAVVVRPITAPQVTGIAIDTNVGVDALFNRADINMVIYSGSVNDAGSYNGTNYQAALSRAISQTKARGVPLIIQAEPAGHYARPTDTGYAAFNTIKGTFAAAAVANPHVVVVDWDAVTRLSDLQTYADTYYSVTAGAVSGAITGDYIHPTTIGQTVGTALLAALFGTRMPPTANETEVLDKLRSTNYDAPYLPDAVIYDRSIGVVKQQVGWALALTTATAGTLAMAKPVPLYDGTGIKETGRPFDIISAAGTSDSDGLYKLCANQSVSPQAGSPLAAGEKWTFSFPIKGTVTISPGAGQFYFGNTPIATGTGAASAITVTTSVQQWITFEWLPNASTDAISITGKIYLGACVTRTQGAAVKCVSGTAVKPHSFIFPDAKLALDPTYNPVFYMQGYRDAASVRKVLVGPVLKWDFAQYAAAFALYGDVAKTWESSWAVKGCYRLSDRTQANFSQVSILGTLTDVPGSIYTGGAGFSSTNPLYYQFPAIDLSAVGLYCTITVPMYGATGMRWQVQAVNGGTIKYLNNDGTWTGTAGGTNFRESTDNEGALCSFTFQPLIAQSGDPNYININNPIIRLVRIAGTISAVGDATFCTGIHSMI